MIHSSWRLIALALATVALLGLTVACGGDDASPKSTATTQSGPADSGIPAGAPEIDQDGLAFKPNKLAVNAGEAVYFRNSEAALHTVTINGKNESGNMKRGAVFSWTPATSGSYKVTCDFHPQMNATITVN